MEHRIQIGAFVKLTGSTLKTVLYYHKIGLLPEPERTESGYRLYGAAELSRMQMIHHLKRLGLDLPRIKEVLGERKEQKNIKEVLVFLREELRREISGLEMRLSAIEKILNEEGSELMAKGMDSASFQTVSDILGEENMDAYVKACPALLEGQKKIFGILDDFHWGADYQENFSGMASFFKDQPNVYQTALEFGVRLEELASLSSDDPAVEDLARDAVAFIKNNPELKNMLSKEQGVEQKSIDLYNDMVATVRTPAQIRFGQLLRTYLALDQKNMRGDMDGKSK